MALTSWGALASAQHWVPRTERTGPKPHRWGWLLGPPSFLFITEQSNHQPSESLYLKKERHMFTCKVTQKEVVRWPQLGVHTERRSSLWTGPSVPSLMFQRRHLTGDNHFWIGEKTYFVCLHNTLALPRPPPKSHTVLKLFPAPLHPLATLVITGSQFLIPECRNVLRLHMGKEAEEAVRWGQAPQATWLTAAPIPNPGIPAAQGQASDTSIHTQTLFPFLMQLVALFFF